MRRTGITVLLLLTVALSSLCAAEIPKWGDSYWRDSIPVSMRTSYIAGGEKFLGRPWVSLPATVFAEFKSNGNRVNYERLVFSKRRQLACLVMAEIAEGQRRFLPDIVDGLLSTMEETWWGLPAHYRTNLPRPDDQNVDLFNAETASLIAYTRHVLAAELDRFSPLLTKRIDAEIARRILQPAITGKYSWKTSGSNWNPWICSNWAACIKFCEHDEGRRTEALRQIDSACRHFMDAYPSDGGCDEGPNYWDRAAASLFETFCLVHGSQFVADGCQGASRRSDVSGAQPVVDWKKLRAMESYIYNMYIPGGYTVNFADCHRNRSLLNVNIAYPFGLLTGDNVMRRHAAFVGSSGDILHNASKFFDNSGNWPSLGRELLFLCHIQEFLREEPAEASVGNTWLPDMQIMTANTSGRSPSAARLFAAFKGGTNGDSHNHNDVGSFVVYADGRPLLIDPGVGEYTAKTFSRQRYEIWTMQSDYHNLPRINGCSQRDGRQYAASVVSQKSRQLTLDIAHAYPADAHVRSWKRTVAVGKEAVSVSEDYELDSLCGATQLMLMTTVPPSAATPGVVRLGNHTIVYDRRQLSASVEDVSPLMDPSLRSMWGDSMYRIVLTLTEKRTKGRLSYTIR